MQAGIRRDQVCHNSKGNRRKRKDVGNNETAIIDDGDRNRGEEEITAQDCDRRWRRKGTGKRRQQTGHRTTDSFPGAQISVVRHRNLVLLGPQSGVNVALRWFDRGTIGPVGFN